MGRWVLNRWVFRLEACRINLSLNGHRYFLGAVGSARRYRIRISGNRCLWEGLSCRRLISYHERLISYHESLISYCESPVFMTPFCAYHPSSIYFYFFFVACLFYELTRSLFSPNFSYLCLCLSATSFLTRLSKSRRGGYF